MFYNLLALLTVILFPSTDMLPIRILETFYGICSTSSFTFFSRDNNSLFGESAISSSLFNFPELLSIFFSLKI